MDRFQLEERLIVFTKVPTDLAAFIEEVITRIRRWRFQMNMQMTQVMFNAKKQTVEIIKSCSGICLFG